MKIIINHNSKIPTYMQIAGQIKQEILTGELAMASVLPSERALAQLLGVHRNTVSKAYAELKSEGVISSRRGVGYIVTEAHPEQDARPKQVNWKAEIASRYLDMEVTFDDIFQRFSNKDKISMGSGLPSPEMYDEKDVAERIARIIAGDGKTQYFYSPYKGDKGLRQKLVPFLSTKGIKATTGQIQILSETNQAIDFLVTLLVRPGDTIVMEEPVSPDAYRAMELAGAKIASVPVDENGMDTDALESLLERVHPRLIYVNSSFHDPTSAILSIERRKKIVELSNRYRIPIIEEDAASELVYDGLKLPPIKSFDTLGNVIYIYSFSLTFVPGLSLAFVVADRQLIESLSYLVSVRMMAVDWTTQKLLAGYLEDGSYYRLLDSFRENYGRKQNMVCEALDRMKEYGISYDRPHGGVYIWCKLPEGVDSKDFVEKAYKAGVSLVPGYVFFPIKNGGRDHIRINFSYESEERLAEGLKLFEQLIAELSD